MVISQVMRAPCRIKYIYANISNAHICIRVHVFGSVLSSSISVLLFSRAQHNKQSLRCLHSGYYTLIRRLSDTFHTDANTQSKRKPIYALFRCCSFGRLRWANEAREKKVSDNRDRSRWVTKARQLDNPVTPHREYHIPQNLYLTADVSLEQTTYLFCDCRSQCC